MNFGGNLMVYIFLAKTQWQRARLALITALMLLGSKGICVQSSYEMSADSARIHVEVLASDSLEGRRVGEAGARKAARYIESIFHNAGLLPKGDGDGYLQKFQFIKRIEPGEENQLKVNGVELELYTEFRPLNQSANLSFDFQEVIPVGYGITVPHPPHDDYAGLDVAGKAVLITRYSPHDTTSGIEWEKYSSLTDKIINAIEHETAGLFFITPEDQDDTLILLGVTRVASKDIPIIWLRRAGLQRLGFSVSDPPTFSASGTADVIRVRDTARNVVGYLPGKSDTTIIIGAHYDHLGWGAPGSLYRDREKKIHYGADDNGSGTSALLELVRKYTSLSAPTRHSMLFIAFSGEEAGLLGSSYFARHMTVDSSKILMMVNMDMVGRLSDQKKGLAIFGTGTCNEFKAYFESLDSPDLTLSFKEDGAGPSDHTAFYNRDIPVLHFFTGAHEDYHKPSDVADKVDYDGVIRVAQLVEQIVNHFDIRGGPLSFQRTKNSEMGKRRRAFSVTLGIMPDYISEVHGLKVDGITPDKTAERAGILKDDIIIRIGTYAIDDIYAYMNALGKFRKGDTTTIVVARGADTLSLAAEFK